MYLIGYSPKLKIASANARRFYRRIVPEAFTVNRVCSRARTQTIYTNLPNNCCCYVNSQSATPFASLRIRVRDMQIRSGICAKRATGPAESAGERERERRKSTSADTAAEYERANWRSVTAKRRRAWAKRRKRLGDDEIGASSEIRLASTNIYTYRDK